MISHFLPDEATQAAISADNLARYKQRSHMQKQERLAHEENDRRRALTTVVQDLTQPSRLEGLSGRSSSVHTFARRLVAKFAATPDGGGEYNGRNNALNVTAFLLGKASTLGLRRDDALQMVLEACTINGLATEDAIRTFTSGWSAGILSEPLKLQQRPGVSDQTLYRAQAATRSLIRNYPDRDWTRQDAIQAGFPLDVTRGAGRDLLHRVVAWLDQQDDELPYRIYLMLQDIIRETKIRDKRQRANFKAIVSAACARSMLEVQYEVLTPYNVLNLLANPHSLSTLVKDLTHTLQPERVNGRSSRVEVGFGTAVIRRSLNLLAADARASIIFGKEGENRISTVIKFSPDLSQPLVITDELTAEVQAFIDSYSEGWDAALEYVPVARRHHEDERRKNRQDIQQWEEELEEEIEVDPIQLDHDFNQFFKGGCPPDCPVCSEPLSAEDKALYDDIESLLRCN